MTSAILVFAFGCSSTAPTATGASPGNEGTTAGAKTLVGKWVGKIEMANKDDAASKMAESFAGMLGNFDLEIREGNRFTLTVMGVPTEGSMVIKDKSITLTPETMMGKTIEDLKKSEAAAGKSTEALGKSMAGEFAADMETITLMDSEKPDSKIVFKRNTEKPKVVGASTVSDAEKGLVGTYKTQADTSTMKADDKTMYEAMKDTMNLVLDQDNTFSMNVMLKMEGTWKVTGNTLNLHPTKMNGMDVPKDSKGTEPAFTVEGTTLKPVSKAGENAPPFNFVKQ